jgi:AraC-like DNA-binding protein
MTLLPQPRLASAFQCQSPEGRMVSAHTHPHHELVFILSGHLTVTTPETTLRSDPGEMQIFPAGTLHDQVSRGPWHTLCAQFSAPLAQPVRALSCGVDSHLRVWMEQLCALEALGPAQQETRDALLHTLLAHLRQHDRDAAFTQSLHPLLAQATSRLSSRLDRELDAGGFARELAISPGYLASLFRSQFGCSPMKWHHALRMQRACSLLLNPYVTVGAVARELGYPDLNYFVRRFRLFHGVSPGRWREQAVLAGPAS